MGFFLGGWGEVLKEIFELKNYEDLYKNRKNIARQIPKYTGFTEFWNHKRTSIDIGHCLNSHL